MVTVLLLGSEDARDEDGRALGALLRQPKRFALLAYLAAALPHGHHPRHVLMGLFWPDADPTHARHALNQALHFLRQVLGNAAVTARGMNEVALNTAVVSCDVWAFRRAMEAGHFEKAVALYRGPLLAGFSAGASVAFEQWIDAERDRLARSYATALEHLAEACRRRGERQQEIAWRYRLAEHDPYSTHVRLRLMEALDAVGDRAGALEQAARHAAKLTVDLHAEPSPDTAAYAEHLRTRPLPHAEIATDPLVRVTLALGRRYAIERELSSGGLATVYLARDLRHGNAVAVKVLRPELAGALGAELFLREITVSATLNHPLILPLLDSGEADGVLYYVMPYVEGESLRERLTREGPLSIDDALSIAREVADALGFAHAHGVLHRDIKPENILLEAGHAVVADFGVAGAVARAGEAGLVDRLVEVGTPVYKSPEQATGSTDLDGRSDQYSLGCVLYEMLAAVPPFAGSTEESLVQQHRSATVPSVIAMRPAVPAWVATALERSLAKAPADRFESLTEFGKAIAPRADLKPADGLPVGTVVRASRKRWASAAVAVVILAVLGTALLLPREGRGVFDPHRVLVVPFADHRGSAESAALSRMAQEHVIHALSEAGFAEVVDPLTVLAASQNVAAAGAVAGDILALADELQAGTIVSGSYYAAGDSVHVQVWISDARENRLLATVGPLVSAVSARRELVARVGQEVTAALAPLLDRDLAFWEATVPQPKVYAAYEAYTEGLEAYLRYERIEAGRHFERAVAVDPTFHRARLWAAQSYMVRGDDYAKAGSLLAVVVEARDQLSRYERCRLDLVGALGPRRNLGAAYAAARCMARAAPDSDDARREVASIALAINRPREAIQLLGELDPDRGMTRHWAQYWFRLSAAYHVLGDYEGELDITRQGVQRFPKDLWILSVHGRALAALGRLNEVAATVAAMRALPAGTRPVPLGVTFGGALATVADELRVHGHPALAEDLVDEAVAWVRAQTQAKEHLRAELASWLYRAGRWDEARRLVEELAERSPEDTRYLALQGRLAALRGDRAEAMRISDALRSFPHPARERDHLRERARIAALLGESARAVALLRRAIEQGVDWGYGEWLHRDGDFESLADYPPFQEMIRPKG